VDDLLCNFDALCRMFLCIVLDIAAATICISLLNVDHASGCVFCSAARARCAGYIMLCYDMILLNLCVNVYVCVAVCVCVCVSV
jgi:hypothetical protein